MTCDVCQFTAIDYLFSSLLMRITNTESKFRIAVPLSGKTTGEHLIPLPMASNAENVSISWYHHVNHYLITLKQLFHLRNKREIWTPKLHPTCFLCWQGQKFIGGLSASTGDMFICKFNRTLQFNVQLSINKTCAWNWPWITVKGRYEWDLYFCSREMHHITNV